MIQSEGTSPGNGKLTVEEFAAKIKSKYPEYKDVDDVKLAKAIIEKYPEYEQAVVFETPKKKEGSQEPFRIGISELPSASTSKDDQVDNVLAFNDAFNPVGRIIKKVPVLADLNAGIESMVGSAFKLGEMFVKENVLAYATANPGYAAAQNFINSAAPVDSKLSEALGSIGDVFMESSSRAMRQKYRDYGIPDRDVELGIIGNIAEGNISSAAKLIASTMVQQVPQLAVMAATGGTAGGVILGATAAGGKYAEIQDDPTLTSQEKALYSLAIGTAEGIAENIFKTDVTQFRSIFGKTETLDAFKKELKKELKRSNLWKSSAEEATEEFLVAVTDNLIESGLKGNFDNWDRDAVLEIADNTLIGGLMGGGIHSVSRGVNAIGTTKNERKILEAKQDVSDLYAKLENATEDQKPIIEELIEERLGFIIDNQSEDAEFYKNFTPEDLKSVNELNKEIRKTSKKYNLAASESQKKVIKKELDELRSKKAEIENKYSENPSRYIKDGKEVSRSEFVEMINNATPEEISTGQWGVQNDDEVEQLLMSRLPQKDSKKPTPAPTPEQEVTVQEPVAEEAAPTTEVQEAKKVKLSDGSDIQEGAQVVAKNPATGKDIQGELVFEGDPDNPRVSVETETDIVELGVASEVNPSNIKLFTEAVKESETLTANEDNTLTYNKEGNPTIPKGTKLTIDTEKGLDAVSVFSKGKFVPLTKDADREKGLKVQMLNQDGEVVELYGQDALDATYNIMLAMNEAEKEQLNKLLDNEETINAITEAEESARKDTESAEKAEGPAVEETGEELDILLLDEDGIVKKESELGGSDPRNVQSGKMTVTYGKDGITFRSKDETGVMGNKGEYFISYEDINTIPGINKLERGTPEYSYRVADFAGVAKQYKDPVQDMFDRIINPEEIGKKGFNSKGRFTESEAKRMANMIDSFKKTLKRLGLKPVNIVLVDNNATAKQYQRYVTGTERTGNTRGTFIPYANTIIINLGKANFSTLAHEMMHAYIYAMKLKGNRVVEFAKIIEQELSKGTEQEQLLAQDLIAFRNAYVDQKIYGDKKADDPLIAEEFLAQYVGLMSQFSEKLGPAKQITFADKVRAAIIKFLSKIGITDKNLVAKIETRAEALNFINGFFDAVNNRTDAVFEKADTETEEQGEGGEVGTISIPKEQIEVIDAPKLSEDKRSFIQKFVTDIKMTALQGRKFVTNMYDYTNAGVTNLGNGFSITLFGGRNYVPMMMERNGVGIGDMSNLAAFNTKSNAEGFIKNATEGKADLFAPHSGTLTDSWQFQHHIFEELVKLVLDNKILSKAELIQTFNEGLKSKAAVEAFATFNERNKSKLKNLSSFKKDPMKLVELLNADNNYSPKLRKALNQKIASNKKFQKAIGINNLREFYNRISDPLNQGVSGGEIMTFVEFDPKSFKIVKTKPGDVNHHPSFGWVVMAKIKGIYHPDKYYKSYDITESYTKYNADGTKVERKGDTTKKKYIDSNVKSSAGAIPKVAQVEMPKEQIDWQPSLFGREKVNTAIITRSTQLQQAVQELLEGKITNVEYQETAKLLSPVDPISKFFLPASNEDMENALGKGKAKKLNVQLEDGEYVGLRLDIPAYVNNNIWVVTAHKGTGAPLTYGSVAWATDVKFGTNPKVAAFIAAGKNMDLVGRYRINPVEVDGKTVYKFFDTKTEKYYAEKGKDVVKDDYKAANRFVADRLEKQDKSTIGKMLGRWKNFEGKTKEDRDASAIKKVEEIVKTENSYPGITRKGSPWRQIGMNPFRHSFFYDRRTGKPVVSAAEVVQIGGLVYAKDVEYADWSNDQFTVDGYYDADGQPVKFQIEGDPMDKSEKAFYKALEKGDIPKPTHKKHLMTRIWHSLFRTKLELKMLRMQESKEALVSRTEEKATFISNKIKKYAKTTEALELANEYLTSDNKKEAKEKILKLKTGPKLLSALREARTFIDNLSEKIIDDPAFSELSDDLVEAIEQNLTTYLRTQYRFFTDKNYNINKRRDPAIKAQFDQLVAQEMAMLKAEGLSNMDVSRIINERWKEIRDEAVEMIDGYIADLEEVKIQPSKGGVGIKLPNAPFKRKKDLPDYIEKLLGKERNPINKFAQTTQALAHVYYKGKMVESIIDTVGLDSDYILREDPGSPKNKHYTKVNDPYSKLNGMWVHNEIMDSLERKPLYSTDSPATNFYYNVLKLARKSKVIWNITTWRKNLTGGWYFIMANGIANKNFAKDFTQRTNLMFKTTGEGKQVGIGKFKATFKVDEETERLLDIMAEYGVSGKNIDANVIGVSQASFQYGIDGNENSYIERLNYVLGNIKNKDKWLQQKYSAVDDYTKLIIFRSEIKTYAKKLFGKEYESLTGSQKDKVHDQAAERVKQSTPTFSRLPKWFDKVAGVPVVGDFVSFRLESLRSYGMNVWNGVDDIKKSTDTSLSAAQKSAYLTAGLRRLAGSGTVFALKFAIVNVLTQLFLGEDEEELAEEAKLLRPEWMNGQTIIPRSIDKDGNVRVYNYSSEDPYGDVSDVFGGPESWSAMVKDFIRPNIAADLIFNLVKGEDIYGNKIADYSDSKINNILKLSGYVGKQIVVPPTVSSSFRDAYLRSELPKGERIKDLASMVAERSVIRDYKYNIVNSLVQDLRKISETRKSYEDYDNPSLRKAQLDDIREKWNAVVAIGEAKGNYEMIDKAERYIKRHLLPVDEDYVFYEE